jgi:hypothetical protein
LVDLHNDFFLESEKLRTHQSLVEDLLLREEDKNQIEKVSERNTEAVLRMKKLKGALRYLVDTSTEDLGLWGEIDLTSQMYEQGDKGK